MSQLAIVTGASRGIGAAIARKLASDGYDVVINYLTSQDEAIKLQQEVVEKYHVNALAIKCDVSDEKQVDAMFQQIEEKLSSVDILVNNAAIDLSNLFSLKDAQQFRRTLDVNVVGAYNCAKRAYKKMLDKKYGKIINISSTNGINTYYPMCFDYDASKAALISLTHNLAIQCSPYVNVNAIAPGFIGTESELDGYDQQFLQQETDKILVKRYGQPQEVAYLVKFLVSDQAKFINNSIIRIDGGQLSSN